MNQNNLWITHKQMILILIVVEDGLVQVSVQIKSSRLCVLILVVVDNGLVQDFMLKFHNDLR